MERENYTLAVILLLVLGLVLGGVVTKMAFPRIVTEVKEVEVKVPAVCPEAEVLVCPEAEVLVCPEAEALVCPEAEALVCPEATATETALGIKEMFVDKAIEDFFDEIDDTDSLQVCGGKEYDDWDIKKIYDGYLVRIDDEDDEEYSVVFKAKVKYLDTDVEEKCYRTFNVEVTYPVDDDEDVDVDIS